MPDLRRALAEALAQPIGTRPLREVATARTRAVVIVSDASRDEPRAELFEAVRAELGALPDDQITLAVANGTHRPGPVERLGLPAEVLRRHRVVNHDSRDEAQLVEVGRTSRGTRLRVNRCLAEADLIVTTGRIGPHPFAGYGGGTTGIFPGLGAEADIRQHRLLQADPASALGRADLNPCREDLEEAARRLGRDTFMLDVVAAGGVITGAVAGDIVLAHRAGLRRLKRLGGGAGRPGAGGGGVGAAAGHREPGAVGAAAGAGRAAAAGRWRGDPGGRVPGGDRAARGRGRGRHGARMRAGTCPGATRCSWSRASTRPRCGRPSRGRRRRSTRRWPRRRGWSAGGRGWW